MRSDDFDFDLPQDLIAQHPIEPRDTARLLEVGSEFRDMTMLDLPGILRPGDLLVLNDTRVVPTRLRGRRGEVRVEITLHRLLDTDEWLAFARPARRLRKGDRVTVADDLSLQVTGKLE
ncbi:MAG TPA: S-adenosylmethionine:tRNA ribosyltransferase-isomerase, partial [Rhodothermales bacterium]